MKIKTADLIGPALDWAVGVAKNMPIHISTQTKFPTFNKVLCRIGGDESTDFRAYTPSTSWSQGGPLIEHECLSVSYWGEKSKFGQHSRLEQWWEARHPAHRTHSRRTAGFGPTPLIAAMRCVVAANLGDEVDVPDELV